MLSTIVSRVLKSFIGGWVLSLSVVLGAVGATISGSSTATTGTTGTYSYTDGTKVFVNPVWTVTTGLGTVQTPTVSSDRKTVTVTILWNTPGTATVTLTDGAFVQTKTVTVSCATVVQPTFVFVTPTICGASGTSTITATPGSGGTQVRWYSALTGGTLLYTGATYTTPTITTPTTYYIVTYNPTSTCESTPRIPVVVTLFPQALKFSSSTKVRGHGSVTLVADADEGQTKVERWYTTSTGGTPTETYKFTTPDLTYAGPTNHFYYYASNYDPATGCESGRLQVEALVLPLISPSNVKTETVRVRGIKQDTQIAPLTDAQKNTDIQYMDGLLRVNQQVMVKASPSGYDIVQPVEFDANGHTSKNYLPYVASTADGTFKSTYKTDQPYFYTKANDKIVNDAAPFALFDFEKSPLGRPISQVGVGADWQQSGASHPQSLAYSLNSASEVRRFKSDGSSKDFYPANYLSKTMVTSEDGIQVIVYQNSQGQTILKKQQLDRTINSTMVNWLETYYIYNEFGQVSFIISPKGVAALQTGSWSLTKAIKDNYTYQFVYDFRGRVIEKKVPGQGWVYYAYDKFNRMVLAQDSLLRALDKWIFTKYDIDGRPVIQGLYLNASQRTRQSVQTLADGLYTASNVNYPVASWYESKGATHGYTNVSFPKINADGSAIEVQVVNYYDNYDFDNNGADDFSYTSQSLAGESTQGRSFGMPTGSKRIILGSSPVSWLYNYVFYNSDGRVIQVRSNNHLNLTPIDNLATNVYDDFEGKLLQTKNYHNAGSGRTTTVLNTFGYDSKGRLQTIKQNNNGTGDQLLAQYEYNELGQLVDKKLHGNNPTAPTSFLQSIDYRYTIRGQISSINNATLTSDSDVTNNETNDYFGMEFFYNKAETSGLGNANYYDGRISAIKWKGVGSGSGTTDQKSYKYTYDKAGKLETATSQLYTTTSAWTKEADAQNESMNYDHNGNIVSLQRNQRKYQVGATASYVSETIDNLTYAYNASNGNKLEKVTDAITGTPGQAGFDNGTSGTTNDYTYDGNGNLLTDQNKGITSAITYNVQGKPVLITFSDGRKLEYIYDASGIKLTMKTYAAGGTLQTTTDYVGGFVYENGTLSFFGSPEGRVVKKGSSLEYQYSIADHQGNTRVVFSSAAPVVQSFTATYEDAAQAAESQPSYLQNYPSTSGINPVATNSHTGTKSQYLNGGYQGMVGVTKSFKVYPGDKVQIDAWARYNAATSNNSSLASFAGALLSAFSLSAPIAGEVGTASSGINSWGSLVASGFADGTGNNGNPKAFVNIILFDKNFNFLDVAYAQVTSSGTPGFLTASYTAKEEGYAYVYISNEQPTQTDVYFDDVTMTLTPTNVIQYNEYYPFGLQASTSWTRDNSTNNFLYNQANELNKTSGWYEMFFRGYDPALGRMNQIDPYATSYSDFTPYNYALNNPVSINDPSGGKAATPWGTITGTANAIGRLNSWSNMMEGGSYMYSDWSENGGYAPRGGGGSSGKGWSPPNSVEDQQLLQRAKSGDPQALEEYAEKYSEVVTGWWVETEKGATFHTDRSFMNNIPAGKFRVQYYRGPQIQSEQTQGEDPADNFHFIHDEAAAYRFMRGIQDLKEEGSGRILGKEVLGVLAINQKTGKKGVLILPWSGNSYAQANHKLGFYETYYEDHEGTRYTPLAFVHTHPNNEIDPGYYADDLTNAHTFKWPQYVLGSLGYVQYYPNSRIRGNTFDLIRENNPVSLFPK